MADIVTTNRNFNGKRSFSGRSPHRMVRVDLTPMVDLGFLLITFFVFTTRMSEAKVMDHFENADGPPRKVKQDAVMTILIGKDHSIYYYHGMLDSLKPEKHIVRSGFKDIRALIAEKKHSTDPCYLMYIIKGGNQATFGDEVDILNEMLIGGIPAGHYAEVELTPTEEAVIYAGN